MDRRARAFMGGMVMAVIVALAPAARGEDTWYTVSQLREQAKAGWHQTYEAYGRTIAIDLTVEVPQVDAIPVLKARPRPAFEHERMKELEKQFAAPKGDKKNYYTFVSRDDGVTAFAYRYPFVTDASRGENELNLKRPRHSLIHFDLDAAYADNNPLPAGEAVEIARRQYQAVFGENEEIQLQAAALADRFYSKKTGKPVREKGAYVFRFRQVIGGVPLGCTSVEAYLYGISGIRGEGYPPCHVDAEIVDDSSFYIFGNLLAQTSVVQEDMPFASFDKAKAAIEELIYKGLVRGIYAMQLAYVLYDDPGDLNNTYFLVPAWVAWAEEYPTARDEGQTEEAVNVTMYYEGIGYKAVIVHAQTGEASDLRSEDVNRSLCPPILTWEQVR